MTYSDVLNKLKSESKYRVLEHNSIDSSDAIINFSSNDYLGLASHPKIKHAAINAINKYGLGAGSSRYVTGNHELYEILEKKLAKLKDTESALVFGNGYVTNIGVITSLVDEGDLVVADKLIHASLIDGIKLSGATLKRFAHNKLEKCTKILRENRNQYKRCIIVTETVFSMDGDIAPIEELYQLAAEYNALLISDDAHGLGLIQDFGSSHHAHIQLGTLSKAAGSYGGYVCASKHLIEYIQNHARPLIYSTALPPAVIAASIAAIDLITSDEQLCAKPIDHARYFCQEMDLSPSDSAIVPYIIGESEDALALSQKLKEAGFMVVAIRPPTVPKSTARLRFTFSASHDKNQIDKLVQTLKRLEME